ncbi:MAG: 4-alpha-glucanotransferase, partial [Synergistes sp.]|nr:4-alpha-glucanotransferase [Synergistes sp.]
GTPRCVSGVPPDYFSRFGQRWGNPLYKWEVMREDNFDWWCARLAHTLECCSLLRVDHFRGLCAYWEIPAEEKTAVNGCWQPALGREMLEAFAEDQGLPRDELPIIAEDLGVITDDVVELMEDFSLPGMKVLMFAFGKDVAVSPYAPHNITKCSIVYTGTHDNDTAVGWWDEGATAIERLNFANYTNEAVTNENVSSIMVRMALSSVADIAVIPVQDLLGLDGSCRMNTPSTTLGNWGWRMTRSELDTLSDSGIFADGLKTMNLIYGRCRLGEED